MSFTGWPDWHHPTRFAGRESFAAYERPGLFFVPPARLETEANDAGSTVSLLANLPLRLDIYQQDRGADGLAEFGVLTLRLTGKYGLEEVRKAAFEVNPDLAIEPLVAESGYFRLDPVAAVELSPELRQVQPLAPSGVSSMTAVVRLSSFGAELLVGALRKGLAALGAQAWLQVQGVAARFDAEVTVESGVLLRELDARPAHSVKSLKQRVIDDAGTLGISLPHGLAADAHDNLVAAIVDRALAEFAEMAPAPLDQSDSGAWFRVSTGAVERGVIRWDLRQPMAAPRLFALATDPLAPLRSLPPDEVERKVVRRHAVPALNSGWHEVRFAPNVPVPAAGLARLTVDVTVPPHPPFRPDTVRETAVLESVREGVPVQLRLFPGEKLDFEYRTSAFARMTDGITQLTGPVRWASSPLVTLAPDDFAVRFIPVEAAPSLLAAADVEILATTEPDGGQWRALATLTSAQPEAAFAVPADEPAAVLSATATALADGQQRTSVPAIVPRLYLDLFSFDGAGGHTASITAEFDDGAPGLTLELRPEAAEQQARTLTLTPAKPSAVWRWLALSPFQSGYCWRWMGQQEWFGPVHGPLLVKSSLQPRRERT